MIGIIEDWLFNQLGYNLNLVDVGNSNVFQDGFIFMSILRKYGLLRDGFAINITKETDQELCKKNLKLLKPIFEIMKVNFTDPVILGIVENNQCAIIQVLFELYVCLENKQNLYFVKKKNYEKIKTNYLIECSKYENKALTNTELNKSQERGNICHQESLIDSKDIIEWYKQKFNTLKSNLNERLNILKQTSSESLKIVLKDKRRSCCCCTIERSCFGSDVKTLPELENFPTYNSCENLLTYAQFITQFKSQQHQKNERKCFENSIHNDLLKQTWSKIMKKQNEIYNSVFSDIMLKQSQYEKQLLTKLIQTQDQMKLQDENQTRVAKNVLEERESQLNCDFQLKEEFEELQRIYGDEQKRVLELHRKLYKEKQEIKRKRNYDLCSKALGAIIDLAISTSQYQSKYGVPVPKILWCNWKELFYQSQPIRIPFQELEYDIQLGNVVDYTENINFEKISDEVLNENDVEEYLFTCGKWFYESVCLDQGSINQNVLAFIVYRLLSLKYPPPPSPLPADLPPFLIGGVLLNFYNEDCIDKLKILLSKPNIHVFDTGNAVKKSIAMYEKETAPQKSEKLTKNKINKTQLGKSVKRVITEKDSKKTLKNKDGKKKVKLSNEITEGQNVGDKIILNNKETQTSIIKEEVDDKVRSPLGLIGEEVANILNSGNSIDESLTVKLIIEYLKTMDDFMGWVILNYPITLYQAYLFELALTGKYLPLEDYDDSDDIAPIVIDSDENISRRKSRLHTPPADKNDKSLFKTHLSFFIKAKHNIAAPINSEQKYSKNENDLFNPEESPDNEVNSYDTETTFLPKQDVMEEFYKTQLVYQEFNFNSWDLDTLKELARTVLKNKGLGFLATNSVELFGEECLNKLAKSKKGDKKGMNSQGSKSKRTLTKYNKKEGKKHTKKSCEKANEEEAKDAATNIYSDVNESAMRGYECVEKESVHKTSVKPGDDEWEFVSLSISSEAAVILATTWENIENSYLQNVKEICFENRMINLRLVPYSTYVKNTIEEVANKPDVRQELVNIFQTYYNSLNLSNLRSFPDLKSHLHCKVFEMQQSLWKIIDSKKQEVEIKRQDIIKENWIVNEICMLTNTFSSLVQSELMKSLETMKLVTDYYLSMLDRYHLIHVNIDQPKINKLTPDVLMAGNKTSSITQNGLKNKNFTRTSIDTTENESVRDSQVNYLVDSLINCYDSERTFEVINNYLPKEIEQAITQIEAYSVKLYSQIKVEADLIAKLSKKVPIEKNSRSKKGAPATDKTENKKRFSKKHSTKNVSESIEDGRLLRAKAGININEVHEENNSLLLEWKFVLDTEIDQFKFRMNLINKRAQEDIIEFYYYFESVLCELYSSNLFTYNTDVNNVNILCNYLRTAIEEESVLAQPIILKRCEFYIEVPEEFTTTLEERYPKDLLEEFHDCSFTVDQLNNLMNIFKIAGPFGIIRKLPFVYILRDLMLFNSSENLPYLPKMWNILSNSQLISVIDSMFGPQYAVDWRDFIIYNLNIPYPNINHILSLRQKYLLVDTSNTELISMEEYFNVPLWFELDLPENPQQGLRIAKIKHLLYNLFKVDEDHLNYTALLLYFCKDLDASTGLRKALCLSLGKNVITSKTELEEILQQESEIKETVINLLESIIHSIVLNREGVLVYEVFDFEARSSYNQDYVASNLSVSNSSVSNVSTNTAITINSSNYSYIQSTDEVSMSSNYLTGLDSSESSWVSKVPICVVISVLNASFLHQDNNFCIRNEYLKDLEEESDSKGMIEASVLVNLNAIQNLFKLTNKFKVTFPCKILEVCLQQ